MKKKDLSLIRGVFIAHRGLHNREAGVPENSMLAFRKAIEQNIPIELDLHVLKDDKVAVFHDDNLKRMTGYDKNIKDCTYDEIKRLTLFDTSEHIPLLEEVLALVDGRVLLDIELKTDLPSGVLEPRVCALLDHYEGAFVVKSFDPFTIHWFKKHRPHFIRGQLSYDFKDNHTLSPLKKFVCRFMLLNVFTQPDFIAYGLNGASSLRIAWYKAKKCPVLIWVVRSEDDLRKAKLYGDGFIFEDITVN